MKHGTRSKYVHDSCRCDECRQANTDYQWAADRRRKRALAAGAVDVEHGTRSTYKNYQCRCEACTAANAAACAAYARSRVEPVERQSRALRGDAQTSAGRGFSTLDPRPTGVAHPQNQDTPGHDGPGASHQRDGV